MSLEEVADPAGNVVDGVRQRHARVAPVGLAGVGVKEALRRRQLVGERPTLGAREPAREGLVGVAGDLHREPVAERDANSAVGEAQAAHRRDDVFGLQRHPAIVPDENATVNNL